MHTFNFNIAFNNFFSMNPFMSFSNFSCGNTWHNLMPFNFSNTPTFNFTPQNNFLTGFRPTLYNNLSTPIFNFNQQNNFFNNWQQPTFSTPNWASFGNFDTFSLSSPSISSNSANKIKETSKLSGSGTIEQPKYMSSTRNLQWWIDRGYNQDKGKKLCTAVKRHLDGNPKMANGKRKVRGQCVGFVRRGINDAFYGGAEQYTSFGKAHLCGEQYLSKDKNFKKLTGVDMSQINPADIPEGVVVLYYPGYSNSAASQVCGHGEVSNGNGKGYSDCLTFLKNKGKQRIKEIWLPV